MKALTYMVRGPSYYNNSRIYNVSSDKNTLGFLYSPVIYRNAFDCHAQCDIYKQNMVPVLPSSTYFYGRQKMSTSLHLPFYELYATNYHFHHQQHHHQQLNLI